ncbi:hypothetical protein E4T52_00132 [Aureobasidium sp. EXF-3400]|nr:hypothetical protein E4T51_01780 [Aureobasidium sp. EXF-12344]KAI4785016.1 hypothetical protein E4T52_00132 [Aureobasidium sp. EXF-3400]
MMENTPVYCFTIPSVSDGTLLDCRIYHPVSLQDGPSTQLRTRKAALIAHPYAPLGGSMDDAVVTTIVDQLLDLDFVVGSFNFRGAADSHGSTSWSGKAERDDYISVAGHLIFYINQLQTSQIVTHDAESSVGHVQSIPSEPITLILGGYSYGSLIVTHLPPAPEILAIFRNPSKWISEILLRARELALQTNTSLSEIRGRIPVSPPARRQHKRQSSSQHSIIYGGNDDQSPADRHIDPTHRGHEIQTRIKNVIHRTHKQSPSTTSTSSKTSQDVEPIPALPHVSPHYLLISPLLPPLSNFLSLSPPGLTFWRHHDHTPQTLLHNPTLVIFGTKDIFTSSTKLEAWCKKMETLAIQNKGSFKRRKVEGASHFWRESGVEEELKRCLRKWVDEVVVREE